MDVLITVPHFSAYIPEEFKSDYLLSEEEMNGHVDFATDRIFDLPGFPVVKATASRFVIDVNRERNDLSEGQGVVITETWTGEKVLKQNLSPETIEDRLRKHYDPFYKKLNQYLSESEKPLFVLDGHSFDSIGNQGGGDLGKERPDICLATGNGAISNELLQLIEEELKTSGYGVERNNPYSGKRGNILNYCSSKKDVQAVGFEINKSIYMDEKTFELNEKEIEKLRKIISKILGKIKNI